MAVPASWPPRAPSGRRSIRFYATGALTANFADNCFVFADAANNANPYVPLPKIEPGSNTTVNLGPSPQGSGQNDASAPFPMIWCDTLRITVVGGDIEFSFDPANPPAIVHGKVLAAQGSAIYRNRTEAGIAVRGVGTFYVEAW